MNYVLKKNQENLATCHNLDEPERHYAKCHKPQKDKHRQISTYTLL